VHFHQCHAPKETRNKAFFLSLQSASLSPTQSPSVLLEPALLLTAPHMWHELAQQNQIYHKADNGHKRLQQAKNIVKCERHNPIQTRSWKKHLNGAFHCSFQTFHNLSIIDLTKTKLEKNKEVRWSGLDKRTNHTDRCTKTSVGRHCGGPVHWATHCCQQNNCKWLSGCCNSATMWLWLIEVHQICWCIACHLLVVQWIAWMLFIPTLKTMQFVMSQMCLTMFLGHSKAHLSLSSLWYTSTLFKSCYCSFVEGLCFWLFNQTKTTPISNLNLMFSFHCEFIYAGLWSTNSTCQCWSRMHYSGGIVRCRLSLLGRNIWVRFPSASFVT